MEPDWENLEALPLSLVLDKLEERIDHVWFGVVCKNWHLVAKLYQQNHQLRSNVLPMLMIPIERNNGIKRGLYGIPTEKVYPLQLPISNDKIYCGFSHGWLAITDASNVITLLNPFKNVAPICLPPFHSLTSHINERNIHKVTLSTDPITSPNDYAVAAIYRQNRCLAFIRAGQKFWGHVCTGSYDDSFTDITFYKGIFYAVNQWKRIVSFSLCPHYPIIHNVISNPMFQGGYDEAWAYLVKSLEGDLWMVKRSLNSFQVYKLELDTQSRKPVEILKLHSLGDNVLFLGESDSISASASYFSNCLQKDSIYYIGDCSHGKHICYPGTPIDLSNYNVKDATFVHRYLYNPSIKLTPSPFWVLPTFQWDSSL